MQWAKTKTTSLKDLLIYDKFSHKMEWSFGTYAKIKATLFKDLLVNIPFRYLATTLLSISHL
jgi:hypothetical protein